MRKCPACGASDADSDSSAKPLQSKRNTPSPQILIQYQARLTMQIVYLIFLGGGIGAVARYAAGLALSGSGVFPFGTLSVNVLGSLLIGFLAFVLPAMDQGGAAMRFFLITGVLGGFTTFSAFSLETLHLLQRGDTMLAVTYVAASVILSLGAAALGWSAGRLF
jgi:fluoride exporter